MFKVENKWTELQVYFLKPHKSLKERLQPEAYVQNSNSPILSIPTHHPPRQQCQNGNGCILVGVAI